MAKKRTHATGVRCLAHAGPFHVGGRLPNIFCQKSHSFFQHTNLQHQTTDWQQTAHNSMRCSIHDAQTFPCAPLISECVGWPGARRRKAVAGCRKWAGAARGLNIETAAISKARKLHSCRLL